MYQPSKKSRLYLATVISPQSDGLEPLQASVGIALQVRTSRISIKHKLHI